ncbi:hypothetical protein H5410_045499 [Solanum commersonii]|uniref:Retrotransposon gag domain-containing protein n=1 Tax=Solanum commersonii TaxID=4109 RepID=A0A9J5X9Q0_SOLCO|nr:hypothetical protein H5410_045499 [Solanum commersonii]
MGLLGRVSLIEDRRVLKASVDDSICDSIQEMKDFICKDLTEFRSILLENPEAWIVLAEHCFDFYKIEEDHKLNVASFYLDGEALKWYQ